MTSSSTLNSEIDAFVALENQSRGQTLASGAVLPKMYNALSGSVPAGGDAVTGIGGIAAGAAAITLPSTGIGNAVVIDGDISTTASTTGADSYSLLVSAAGVATLTDNNTGYSQTITNSEYLAFDGGATTSSGAFQQVVLIEGGVNADMAAMYNAAYGRIPDLAGLEFYIAQYGSSVLPNLTTMATYFLGAPEFKTHWPTLQTTPDNGGPNDVAYIDALYGQILGRTPDAAEIQFYVNALQGKLTDSGGNAIAASTRSDLLVYFSISPENLSKVSATNGGWLVDLDKGAVSLGAMSSSTATTVLASEVANGTVNGSDFSNLSDSANIYTQTTGGSVGIIGSAYNAGSANQQADAEISSDAPNITINLTSKYKLAGLFGLNDTVNSPSTGGAIVLTPSAYSDASITNNGGTINFSGNFNWVQFGNDSYATTTPTIVHGWNSTDIMGSEGSIPSYRATATSLLANPDAAVLTGSASNPVSGASIPSNSLTSVFAINVGSIANDSVAAIVSAANNAFHENGNYVTNAPLEQTFFFGQDPAGNTMVWSWRGDSNHTGTVQASDITGGLELVGIAASSLTVANFH